MAKFRIPKLDDQSTKDVPDEIPLADRASRAVKEGERRHRVHVGCMLIPGAIAAGILVFGGVCTPISLYLTFHNNPFSWTSYRLDSVTAIMVGMAVAVVPALLTTWLIIRSSRHG